MRVPDEFELRGQQLAGRAGAATHEAWSERDDRVHDHAGERGPPLQRPERRSHCRRVVQRPCKGLVRRWQLSNLDDVQLRNGRRW